MIPEEGIEYVQDAAFEDLMIDDKGQIRSSGTSFSEDELIREIIGNYLSDYINDEDAKNLINILVRLEYLDKEPDRFAGNFYSITPFGVNSYDSKSNSDRPLGMLNKYGGSWMHRALKEIFKDQDRPPHVSKPNAGTIDIPASDRFVTVDHNRPENIEGLAAAKAAVAEVKNSNSFKELFADPNDAAIVLSDMEYGISLLEGGKAVAATIKTVLVDRLKWLQDKLPDWAGSAAVSQALQWLVKLIAGG